MTSVSSPPPPPAPVTPMQNLELVEEVMMTTNESFTECQHNMLERLSKNPTLVVASQQRDEPDLSAEQKLDKLKELLSQHPDQFLARFGKYLKYEELDCFREFDGDENDDGFGVAFHLKELERSLKDGLIVVLAGALNKQLKNRRYEALKKLVETTDYFSEEEMQRRNPILYDQLIGKYHTQEERAAFLQQSYKSTSGGGTTTTPLTDLFLAHLERTTEGVSCRRMAQESQQNEEDEADAEYDSDEDEDYDMEGSSRPGPSSLKVSRNARPRRAPTINDDDAPREELEEEEKDLLKEEFFTTMYRDFLNGKDDDFDYSTVDDNPDYDCGEDLENDEEEKYFDVEEPCEVSEPNSDLDDLFRPPVRSGEIESKIEKLSVVQSEISENEPAAENQDQSSVLMTGNDEEEDELDAYMREIEKQLQN